MGNDEILGTQVADQTQVTEVPSGDKSGAPPPEPEPEITRFFSRPKREEPKGIDPSKLPPELQTLYKSMQSDYTRKTTEVSEARKQFESERQKFLGEREAFQKFQTEFRDLLQGRVQPQAGQDPMEQVKALREQGMHDEADKLLMETVRAQSEQALEPVKREAQLNQLRTTFRDVSSEALTSDPVASKYRDYVVQTFDLNTPVMNAVRAVVTRDEQSMRTLLPVVMHFIGLEAHARNLEETFEKQVEAEAKRRYQTERSKAQGLPARLLESGSTSREGPPPALSLRDSVAAAIEQLKAS